jgi:Xaa-Pro dipeptidase
MAGTTSSPAFQMSPSCLPVPMSLFADNRRRLCQRLREGGAVPSGTVVVLQGGEQECLHSSDREIVFRQESYFHWLFGVTEADCYAAVEVDSGRALLFVPRLPADYATWMGEIYPPEHFQRKYAIDTVHYTDEIAQVLKKKNPPILLTLVRFALCEREHVYTHSPYDTVREEHGQWVLL